LRDAGLAVTERLKPKPDGTAATSAVASGAVPAAVAALGAGAAESVKEGSKVSHKVGEQASTAPPLEVRGGVRSDREDKVAASIIRQGLQSSRDMGVALIRRDLTIVDANTTFCSLMFGPQDTAGADAATHLDKDECEADATVAKHSSRSPGRRAGAPSAGADEFVGAKRKEPSGGYKAELQGSNVRGRGKGDASVIRADGSTPGSSPSVQAGNMGEHPAEANAAQAGAAAALAMGRIIGVSMREFVHRDDERQLSLAFKHVTDEAYADDGLRHYFSKVLCTLTFCSRYTREREKEVVLTNRALTFENLCRRYVLGLRFKAMSLGSPRTCSAHTARPLGSAGGWGGWVGGVGAERWTARPVEILPCNGSLYGQMFIILVFFNAWMEANAMPFNALMEANAMPLNLLSEPSGTCPEVGTTDSEFGEGVRVGGLLQGLQAPREELGKSKS